MLGNALREAIRSLGRNALRSFLTVLGIVIGVGAVIAMVTLGRGATQAVSDQISSLGSNIVFLRPSRGFGPGQNVVPFKVEDALAIAREVPGVAWSTPVSLRTLTVVAGNQSWSTTVVGAGEGYLEARRWEIVKGRGFTPSELRAGVASCIVGQTVARELFGSEDPIGQRMRVDKFSCEIIGLLDAKGQSAMGTDQDDIVIIPLRTYQRRISGTTDVDSIQLSLADGIDNERVLQDIRLVLRERRHLSANMEDNFRLIDSKEIERTLTSTTRMLTVLLGAVAGISLLVGGIGIMNIMLVSVTERTREIGIRLAIGARAADVMLQFLVEAVVLALLGGAIGITLALVFSLVAAQKLGFPFSPDYGIVLIAALFSGAIGIVFGFFPARRAARLDPIEALRHE